MEYLNKTELEETAVAIKVADEECSVTPQMVGRALEIIALALGDKADPDMVKQLAEAAGLSAEQAARAAAAAQNTADKAQTAANNAQAAADNAQTSADNAQTTADDAQTAISQVRNDFLEGDRTLRESLESKINKVAKDCSDDGDALALQISETNKTLASVKSTADKAETDAGKAQSAADKAQTAANNAKTAADNAQTSADNAKTAADSANANAIAAGNTASNAMNKATMATAKAEQAQTAADNAMSEVLVGRAIAIKFAGMKDPEITPLATTTVLNSSYRYDVFFSPSLKRFYLEAREADSYSLNEGVKRGEVTACYGTWPDSEPLSQFDSELKKDYYGTIAAGKLIPYSERIYVDSDGRLFTGKGMSLVSYIPYNSSIGENVSIGDGVKLPANFNGNTLIASTEGVIDLGVVGSSTEAFNAAAAKSITENVKVRQIRWRTSDNNSDGGQGDGGTIFQERRGNWFVTQWMMFEGVNRICKVRYITTGGNYSVSDWYDMTVGTEFVYDMINRMLKLRYPQPTTGGAGTVRDIFQIPEASTSYAGFMSAEDKIKLNNIGTGAKLGAGVNITSTNITTWNNKVSQVAGKGLSTNDFTDAYKEKLDGIEDGVEIGAGTLIGESAIISDDVSIGPNIHIVSTRSGGTVTLGEGAILGDNANIGNGVNITSTDITTWNNKVDQVAGKGLSTNDFTEAYKEKLDDIGDSVTFGDLNVFGENNEFGDNISVGSNVSLSSNVEIDIASGEAYVFGNGARLGANSGVVGTKISYDVGSRVSELGFRDIGNTGRLGIVFPSGGMSIFSFDPYAVTSQRAGLFVGGGGKSVFLPVGFDGQGIQEEVGDLTAKVLNIMDHLGLSY